MRRCAGSLPALRFISWVSLVVLCFTEGWRQNETQNNSTENRDIQGFRPPHFGEARLSTAAISCHSARHFICSSADNFASALGSRSPARSGSVCQCVSILLTQTGDPSDPLSSVLAHIARSPRNQSRACLRQRARSASPSLAPSSPNPQPARAAHRAAGYRTDSRRWRRCFSTATARRSRLASWRS